jgi:hypothetical protein
LHLDVISDALCRLEVVVPDCVDQKAFLKRVQLLKVLDLSKVPDTVNVLKKPMVNEALLHLVEKERSHHCLEVLRVLEEDEEVYFMTAEVRVLLVLLFKLKGVPFHQEF